MLDAQLPVLLKDSRYAERLPIGKPEIIRTFPYDRLKKFYTDWYRPDLMAVIAVGDFDPAAIGDAHQGAFRLDSGCRCPASRDRCTTCPISRARATRSRPTPRPRGRPSASPAPWRRATRRRSAPIVSMTVERMFAALLSARLAEMAQKPDAPFLAAQTNRGLFVQSAEATTLSALVPDGGAEKGLAALLAEADRVARFGFTQTELDRYRLTILRVLRAARIVHRRAHLGVAGRRVHPQLHAGRTDPRHRLRVRARAQRFLPEITLADVNGLARDWVPDRNRVVSVSAPTQGRRGRPDRGVAGGRHQGRGRGSADGLCRHRERDAAARAVARSRARWRRRRSRPSGITEWTLSNGVRVVLQPTTFKQDEILFRAFSPGGTSLAADARLHRRRDGRSRSSRRAGSAR